VKLKNNRIITILLILGLFSILSIPINSKLISNSKISYQINSELRELNISKIFSKIYINNNWSDAKTAGICTGSGNYSDPYVIEDLVIDANGSGSCIWIVNSSFFFRIENCTFYNSRRGTLPPWPMQAAMVLQNVSNGQVINNNILNNDVGMIASGNNNSITSNLFKNNIIGIYSYFIGGLPTSYNINQTFTENDISKNSIGIFTYGSDLITQNNIKHNDFGIYVFYSLSIIIENRINNNLKAGILLDESYGNYIARNELNNNKIHGIWIRPQSYWWTPQLISFPGFNRIIENKFNNNSFGIMLNYTTDNYILNNSIKDNEKSGVELYFSDSNTISNNNLTGSYYGIKSNESILNEINQNMINDNQYGISLISSHKNNVILNTINYNHYGISFTASIRNEIISNTLHYNWMCYVEDQDSGHNNFENNDCIETRKKVQDWLVPLLITTSTTSTLVGLTILVILYLRYKRK
jgi:parallel beta-helix repeat protein